MSEKIWSDDAWKDYLYWQTQDKKTLKRINQQMGRSPDWMPDILLRADGYETEFCKKD